MYIRCRYSATFNLIGRKGLSKKSFLAFSLVDQPVLLINSEGREAKGLSKGRYDETFAGEDGMPHDANTFNACVGMMLGRQERFCLKLVLQPIGKSPVAGDFRAKVLMKSVGD